MSNGRFVTEFIILLHCWTQETEKKGSGGKIAEQLLGKNKNFPLPLALRTLTCPIREIALDLIIRTALPTPAQNRLSEIHRSLQTKKNYVLVWKVFVESLLSWIFYFLRELTFLIDSNINKTLTKSWSRASYTAC